MEPTKKQEVKFQTVCEHCGNTVGHKEECPCLKVIDTSNTFVEPTKNTRKEDFVIGIKQFRKIVEEADSLSQIEQLRMFEKSVRHSTLDEVMKAVRKNYGGWDDIEMTDLIKTINSLKNGTY
jgi:hypothetical protein